MSQENGSVWAGALSGVLHFFFETGTEGGDWAFQESRYIQKNVARGYCKKCGHWLAPQEGALQVGRVTVITEEVRQELLRTGKLPEQPDCADGTHEEEVGEAWDYKGLHILGDGDCLRILSPDNSARVVWEGMISLIQYDSFTQHASGLWIHADQQGVPRETWAEWSFKGYPAKLIPVQK